MTTRSRLRVSRFADYESTTISKKALCQLQDCEAQERGARDLQEPTPQATPGIKPSNLLPNYLPCPDY